MRHYQRNADPRLRDLQRRLSESPGDVQLQHAAMIATVRAGELPHEAIERLIPGRPVQPWQWLPASYVLLEAESIGRESEWQEGKVEIEWISESQLMHLTFGPPAQSPREYHDAGLYPASSLPYWGIEGERAMTGGATKSSLVGDPDWIYFNPATYHKVFVGAREVNWEHTRIVAGLDPRDSPPPSANQNYMDYVLSVLPPRWIPNLDHVTAYDVKKAPASRGLKFQNYIDDLWTGREEGEPYRDTHPDAYDPQMLLFASKRVVRAGKRAGVTALQTLLVSRRAVMAGRKAGVRALQAPGPLLDVRLINRVRIMERRGKRWV